LGDSSSGCGDRPLVFPHKEIVISPKHIDRISYEESKVFVNVSKEAILEAPQYHVSPLGETYGDTRNFD
jgi:hypothetical protein